MIFSILLPLLAQVGPSVGPGAGGALPQAPIVIPRKAAGAAPATPVRRSQCRTLASNAPSAALVEAEAWLEEAKGAALGEATACQAIAFAALERWTEAEAAFLSARDLTPASALTDRAELAAGAAIAAEGQGSAARALDHFTAALGDARALDAKPLIGRILRDRAASLVQLGRTDEARASLAEARTLLPQDALTWLISARLARRLEQLGEAQSQIEVAARLNPRDPDVGLEAGLIAALQGRDAAARRSWQSVILAAPGTEAARAAQSWLDRLGPDPAPSGR